MATMTPIDIFNALSEREREQVRATLNIRQPPCEVRGHKYRPIATTDYLISFLNKTTMCCTQCGKTIKV